MWVPELGVLSWVLVCSSVCSCVQSAQPTVLSPLRLLSLLASLRTTNPTLGRAGVNLKATMIRVRVVDSLYEIKIYGASARLDLLKSKPLSFKMFSSKSSFDGQWIKNIFSNIRKFSFIDGV